MKSGFEIDTELPEFDFISLIEIARNKRFDVLKKYLDYIRKKMKNHFFIVLDVVTDCISNFNDMNKSMKLINFINIMINHFNVTFLCVIHENTSDGSTNARAFRN